MVQLEIRKMLAVVSVDDLNEQDLEQWYDDVTAVTEHDQLDFELDRQQCENMFKLFQRILLYKGEQVRQIFYYFICVHPSSHTCIRFLLKLNYFNV